MSPLTWNRNAWRYCGADTHFGKPYLGDKDLILGLLSMDLT